MRYMTDKTLHISVLQDEAVEALAIKSSSTIVDATLGSSGHAKEITARLGKKGTFIGIDADSIAIENAKKKLEHANCTTQFSVSNFRNIDETLNALKIEYVDGILADLGWRMDQFGGNGKGFSFQYDEELLMTFGDPTDYPFVAKDILNEWKEEDIKNVLKGYGEEKFSGRIARHIVEQREIEHITRTFQLVSIIENAVPAFYRKGKIHPATRTFQALRIAVNDEFDSLETFIRKSVALLAPHGRLVIITFHSTEDRIVKHTFKNLVENQVGSLVTKKPIAPTREEVLRNPRSRSAKMRVFEKNETT
jgi:16S rRNA (cytosine1402-N4)-methyltransferase